MLGLTHAGVPHERSTLSTGWRLCGVAPVETGQAATPPGTDWQTIPELGVVAACLRALGQWSLNDPAYRFDGKDWWYQLHFDAAPARAGERVVLGFDGLATQAEVWLNGIELLQSDNMFMAHSCDVSSQLRPQGNTLLLRFAALDKALEQRRKRPRWRAPMVEHQQLRWHRTTVLGRTPGWSPPAAAVGPWRDIWLERRKHFEMEDLQLQPSLQGTDGLLHASLNLRTLGGQSIDAAALHVRRGDRVVSQALVQRSEAHWQAELRVASADVWWPHTHGEPCLYTASLTVRQGTAQFELPLGRVGFRNVALRTEGGDFSLSVNGVPVFCRGACWTPLDPVRLRAGPDAYEAAVRQVQQAGMNMLRVAGTMVYEDDAFFDACDAQGVLVWQDFMFANMDFPLEDAGFAATVQREVEQQLARIAHRASLAVLCGNSEVAQQAAMWGAPRGLWNSAYFESELAQRCAQLAGGTPYWPSSAYGGAFAHQGNVGTTSYYGVGAYERGLEDARRSELKFATECLAFANIPEDAALERLPNGLATRVHHPAWKARSPRDLGAGWDFDDVRDHYVERLFRVQPHKLRYADHERYLTLGRMASAEAMAASFAEWRRPASTCKGALVLFLQDLWPGAGWGLLDDAGQPKACFYALRRVLQPLAVLLSDEGGNGLFVHVVNERAQQQTLDLEISAWRNPAVRVAGSHRTVAVAAHGASSMAAQEWFEHFMDLSYAYRFGPCPCDVVIATMRDSGGQTCGQAFYFPQGMPLHPMEVGLEASCLVLDACTVQVSLNTQCLALGLHFDVPGYVPDDAYFHMAPQSEVQVLMRSAQPRAFFGTARALNAIGTVSLSLSA